MVIVPKPNGAIRLCLDMGQANQAIIRGRHPIPTVEEILQSMNGSTVFSKLDLKWGYHQLELTPKLREITNFAVHSGVYRYKRLIFGVSSASELYQHEISRALAGIEGVENISDNIIVHGPNQATHDECLHAVMQRLKAKGLTLNPDKCQLSINRLIFMGILISEKGICPTKERIRAVVEAKRPENARELWSFIGLANYSARFIPQFATITEPLRCLLHKEVPYEFGSQQEATLCQLKKAMAEASTLAHFDKDAPTQVIAMQVPLVRGQTCCRDSKTKRCLCAMLVEASVTAKEDIRKQRKKHYPWSGHVKDSMCTYMHENSTLSQTTNLWKSVTPSDQNQVQELNAGCSGCNPIASKWYMSRAVIASLTPCHT